MGPLLTLLTILFFFVAGFVAGCMVMVATIGPHVDRLEQELTRCYMRRLT